ncbi:MAG: penicillin acylase family protein [Bdellovibrionales bacterium]|nr:penicillin acylase family protein [Bdellovibrionales bacterium]
MKRFLSSITLSLGISVVFASCGLVTTKLETKTFQQRIQEIPDLPISNLRDEVRIRWNDRAVPFIQANSDQDAFFALGLVHAHLRLGQMEILKRLASGRLSEMVGPFARDIDHTLRIVGIGRASGKLLEDMDAESKGLLSAFVSGINWYQNHLKELPPEYELLGMEQEQWSEHDVLLITRLAGVDLSWIFYLGFLRIEDESLRSVMWQRFLAERESSPSSFSAAMSLENARESGDLERLVSLLKDFSRSGSNSVVVSGEKSKSGAALIASDPHLGISIPNFWLLAGIRSESFHVVGMMIPGIPFFALGRNPTSAWGGTNMRGISTHLYSLGEQEVAEAEKSEVTISSRGWFDDHREIRNSKYGPILSDSPLLPPFESPIAFQWVGHLGTTNEIGSFLRASRAESFEEFREAFAGYGVSAQNLLYADINGNVGQILAYHQPILRDPSKTLDLIKSLDNPIVGYRDATALPAVKNPPDGFIASANNRPVELDVPIALSYAHPDRYRRLVELLSGLPSVTVDDLMRVQQDVFSESSLQTRDRLMQLLTQADTESFLGRKKGLFSAFAQWDGNLSPSSRGALAYHLVLSAFVPMAFEQLFPDRTLRTMLLRGSYWLSSLNEMLHDSPTREVLRGILLEAFAEATSSFYRYDAWGDLHRQRIQHPLGRLPLVGYRFQFEEYGAPGGNDTLLKSGHGFSLEKHFVTYGAQARHISDLQDIDANYFVLLGGQDGWLENENLTDQVDLWQRGEYIHLPLSKEEVEKAFPFVTHLHSQKCPEFGKNSVTCLVPESR